MFSKQKNSEYEEMQRWLAQTDWQVFGTLKLTDGTALRDDTAHKVLRTYFNKLDRVIAGQGRVLAGQRVQRTVFKHYGSSGQNLHFHFLARPGSDVGHFCMTARCLWEQASGFTESFENTDIKPIRNLAAASKYVLHEHWRLGADTLVAEASHLGAYDMREREITRFKRVMKQYAKNTLIIKEPDTETALDA